jgi:hypothetical protein
LFKKAFIICNYSSASKFAMAKLDILKSIILNRKNPPLVLKLAYFYLIPTIKALEYVAKVDWLLS